MSVRAPPLLSPYVFVLLPAVYLLLLTSYFLPPTSYFFIAFEKWACPVRKNSFFLKLQPLTCTFTSFKCQMLVSVMSKQAWPRLSTYAFALRAIPSARIYENKFSCITRFVGICPTAYFLLPTIFLSLGANFMR